MAPERFASVLSPGEYEALLGLVDQAARELHGRVIWNVNSTAKGGGVVEMLRPLLGYCRGAGVDARWAVVSGQPEFFAITKRIHNRLHGFEGDGGPLGDAEREVYERTLAASAAEFAELVHPQDIVILHDPQTAGLAAAVRETGATVMWRCHVGLDVANDRAREAWDFLRAVRPRCASVRLLSRGVRVGGPAARAGLGDPPLDRRLRTEERRSAPRSSHWPSWRPPGSSRPTRTPIRRSRVRMAPRDASSDGPRCWRRSRWRWTCLS